MARKGVTHERAAAMTGVRPSWMMQFAKAYPEAKRLSPGIENARLEGALDVHVHADPCSLIARSQDYTEVALECARAGMRAVVRKDHMYSTVGEALAIQRHVDDLVERGALAHRIEVYGGVPTRFCADSSLVRDALRFGTLKEIWMNPVGGVSLLDGTKVREEVRDLIKLARDNRIGLNFGPPNHSSVYGETGDYDGLAPLVEAVAEIGCLACLDHPLSSYDVDEIEKLTPPGVYAGLFCFPSLPSIIKGPLADPQETLELVRRIGPERCIVASDVGTMLEPTTLESMRLMVRFLLTLGLSERDVDLMLKVNPAKLIGLEPPALKAALPAAAE